MGARTAREAHCACHAGKRLLNLVFVFSSYCSTYSSSFSYKVSCALYNFYSYCYFTSCSSCRLIKT